MMVMKPVRHLVLPRPQALSTVAAASIPGDDPDTAELAPGEVQLHAYYKPSLVAGTYTIKAEQTITETVDSSKHLMSSTPGFPGPQDFEVIAPQFTIDPKDIHSTYPPQGHADQPSVLPHIVFNDPHLPWERDPLNPADVLDRAGQDPFPWLAVLPFDCKSPTNPELAIPQDLLKKGFPLYKTVPPSNTGGVGGIVPGIQSPTFAINMQLQEYLALNTTIKSSTPTVFTPKWDHVVVDDALTTPVDVIFLSLPLFKQIFPAAKGTTGVKVDLTSYRYCCHVRNINTSGMADAGVEDDGLFSIVHSLRTGPLDIQQGKPPRSQAVHLITLECLDQIDVTNAKDTDYVAIVSLYSWLYLCQPPLSVNFTDSLRDLGEKLGWGKDNRPKDVLSVTAVQEDCMLRCSQAMISAVDAQATLAEKANDVSLAKMRRYMRDRLTNGYSLVRHRLASGEVSVAFNRSPFAPVLVTPAAKDSDWPGSSNNGQDFLILDKYLQVMDVSYSSAWQLGKVLAMSDMHFVTAIGNLRSILHGAGSAAGDNAVNQQVNAINIPDKAAVLTAMATKSQAMSKLSRVENHTLTPSLLGRWSEARSIHSTANGPARLPEHPTWKSAFKSTVRSQLLAMSTPSAIDRQFSSSPDWDIVHNWILDKAFFFDSVPYHYLITDAAHLPTESLRFFHIDPNWTDCFIDGALSVANHLSRDDDTIRIEMKSRLNTYLSTKDSNGQFPQTPVYGFFIRSAIVKIFPDIHIDVPFPSGSASSRPPILLQRRIREDTLVVLLDRTPDGGEIDYIRISQPPHQQRFSAGDFLDETKLEFLFREVYPWEQDKTTLKWNQDPNNLQTFGEADTFLNPKNPPPVTNPPTPMNSTFPVYNWDSRCLSMPDFGGLLFSGNSNMKTGWNNGTLNSAIVGIELNDTLKYLELTPPKSPAKLITLASPRHQIFISEAEEDALKNPTQNQDPASNGSGLVTSIQPIFQPVTGQAVQPPSRIAPRAIPPGATTVNKPEFAVGGQSTTQGTLPIPATTVNAVQFSYKVFPSTTKYQQDEKKISFVNTLCPYPPDLIFSIRRRQQTPNLFLHQIDFRIPYGGPEQRTNPNAPKTDGLLPNTNSFIGSARMLSDQRFVVHTNQIPGYVVVSVIPRTRNLSVSMNSDNGSNLMDLSFKLNEVEISGDDGSQTKAGQIVTIEVIESYGGWVKNASGNGRIWRIQTQPATGVSTFLKIQRSQSDLW